MVRFAAFIVLMVGCAPAPVVEVGTGHESFEELPMGGEVTLINGPQGGYHVLLAIKCEGCDPVIDVRYGISDLHSGEGLTFDGLQRTVPLQPRGDWAEYAPLVGFLRENDPSQYIGREVVLWAEMDDPGGVVAASVEAVIAAE